MFQLSQQLHFDKIFMKHLSAVATAALPFPALLDFESHEQVDLKKSSLSFSYRRRFT